MRYGKEHKAATRQRVLEAAARRFRRDGLEGVGVAEVMADAGLTHGGFYSHFASKEALIEEVLEQSPDTGYLRLAEAARAGGLEGFLRAYLSPGHRARPDMGCTAAALGAEIARHTPETRAAFTRRFQRSLSRINALLPEPNEDTALAIFATLIGTIQLARAVPDEAASDRLLENGVRAALALAGVSAKRAMDPPAS